MAAQLTPSRHLIAPTAQHCATASDEFPVERSKEPIPAPPRSVAIRVLGVDRGPILGTLLQTSDKELQVRLYDTPAPRHRTLDSPLRIDGTETTVLGELAGCRTEGGETILTITIRHVLTHLSELARMRHALLQEGGPAVEIGSNAFKPKTDKATDRNS